MQPHMETSAVATETPGRLVALVTDPSSPGWGSRGFSQAPPSSAAEPLVPSPPTLPQIWPEFLCEFLQVSNFPPQVVDLKARPLIT